MSAHTPGPWTTQIAPHRAWIAAVGNNRDDPQIWTERQAQDGESYVYGDKLADARLIAAAPELLVALEAFLDWAARQCPCENEQPDPCPLCGADAATGVCKAIDAKFPASILANARAAIAKATRT